MVRSIFNGAKHVDLCIGEVVVECGQRCPGRMKVVHDLKVPEIMKNGQELWAGEFKVSTSHNMVRVSPASNANFDKTVAKFTCSMVLSRQPHRPSSIAYCACVRAESKGSGQEEMGAHHDGKSHSELPLTCLAANVRKGEQVLEPHGHPGHGLQEGIKAGMLYYP